MCIRDSVRTTQGVGAGVDGSQDAVRVVAHGLIGARSVEAPDTGLLPVRDDPRLAPEERGRLGPVDPDVLSLIRHVHSSIARLFCCSTALWRKIPTAPVEGSGRGLPPE